MVTWNIARGLIHLPKITIPFLPHHLLIKKNTWREINIILGRPRVRPVKNTFIDAIISRGVSDVKEPQGIADQLIDYFMGVGEKLSDNLNILDYDVPNRFSTFRFTNATVFLSPATHSEGARLIGSISAGKRLWD